MKKILSILVLILACLAAIFYLETKKTPEGTILEIGGKKIQVEIAATPLRHTQGLSGRSALCADCGMLFVVSNAQIQEYWMKGMNFPLDFIFIRHDQVVGVAEDVPVIAPGTAGAVSRISTRVPVDRVLEVNAGFVARHQISVGDKVLFEY